MQKILIVVPAAFDNNEKAMWLETVARQIREGETYGWLDDDMQWEFS